MDAGDFEQNSFDINQGVNPEFFRRVNEAFERVQQELSQQIDQQIREIRNSNLSEQEQKVEIKELGEKIKERALESLHQHEEKSRQPEQEGEQGDILKKQKKQAENKVKRSLIEMTIAAKKGIEITSNTKAQAVLQSLADKRLTEFDAGEILKNLKPYILGDKEIVFSTSGQAESDFEKAVSLLQENNPEAAQKVVDSLIENAAQFGKQGEELREKFSRLTDQINQERLGEESTEATKAIEQYFPNFSTEQQKFLVDISRSDLFLKHIHAEIDRRRSNSGEIDHLKENIIKVYRKQFNREPQGEELRGLIEKNIMIGASEETTSKLIDVYIQLYWQVFTGGAHKGFEDVENEDFMHGINVIRNYIFRSLQKLHTDLSELEKNNPNDPRLVKLYKSAEEEYYIQEMTFDGQERPVPRLRPIPYFKEVNLSDFVINLLSEGNHWRERTSYLHNVKLTYGHPAQEAGSSFYKGLGNYAEQIKGSDFDSFMLLPDAPLILEAYQLYEKFLDEEYASLDWRLRANMFSNELSDINSRLERQIKEYLLMKYHGQLSETRLLEAVHGAVGLARGIFLTEPEKNAYADPTTAKGTGYWASYGTNDASSIMAFNPLHRILRWQGHGHLNQIFFMPLTGKRGNAFWDHNEMVKNIQAYQENFIKLKSGTEGTTHDLMIDQLLRITKAGGIFTRSSWRDFYAFESHYVIDGTDIDLLKTFKAMDVIGYEGIKYFLDNIDNDLYNYYQKKYLSAKADTAEANQREELFKYIYKRYFSPFSSLSYEEYMSKLEDQAIDALKSEKTDGRDEKELIQKKISELFIKRTIVREVAARFPTKFLRIDKDRYHEDNRSYWRKMFELMKQSDSYKDLTRDKFDLMMKDLGFVEMLLRSENSGLVNQAINLTGLRKDRSLGDYDDMISILNPEKIRGFLKNTGFDNDRVNNVLHLYNLLNKELFQSSSFLDKEAMEVIKKYPFSFGLEDTDVRLIAFRGTGPRMIARSIKDTALLEEKVINGLLKLPKILNEISIDGKNNFSKVIQYLLEAQDALREVHGVGEDYEFVYKVAGMVINYFKKDTTAKPFFGLFGARRLNSIAAEYAGRGTTVWEWDSRDIDRFIIALESNDLLQKIPYDKTKGPRYEDRYIKPFGKQIKFGQKMKTDFEYNAQKLRNDFGGDGRAIAFDIINNVLPLVLLFILWQYIKRAFEETEGKKK